MEIESAIGITVGALTIIGGIITVGRNDQKSKSRSEENALKIVKEEQDRREADQEEKENREKDIKRLEDLIKNNDSESKSRALVNKGNLEAVEKRSAVEMSLFRASREENDKRQEENNRALNAAVNQLIGVTSELKGMLKTFMEEVRSNRT